MLSYWPRSTQKGRAGGKNCFFWLPASMVVGSEFQLLYFSFPFSMIKVHMVWLAVPFQWTRPNNLPSVMTKHQSMTKTDWVPTLAKSIHWKARTATRKWTRFLTALFCPGGETVDEHVFLKGWMAWSNSSLFSSPLVALSLCACLTPSSHLPFSLSIFFLKAYKKPGFWVCWRI